MHHTTVLLCFFATLLCALVVPRDYWVMNFVKDNISIRLIYPWMHQRDNYWIHKRQHLGNRNTTQTHAAAFGIWT